jgi:ABC-type antimicrobial peptide transport system permease subunit
MKLIRSDIFENRKMAMDMLWSNRLRSFLTVIGVVIGVWTVMAIASIMGIGLIFGLWLVWKAARLDPIEALHYE